jgi:hypothetical protein
LHRRIGEALKRGELREGVFAVAGEATLPQAALAVVVRRKVRRSRRRRLLVCLSAAASIVIIPALLWWTGPASNRTIEPELAGGERDLEEQVIADLDVLESFHEEGLEPTPELVSLLLEETERSGGEALPQDLFDDFLEEELSGENL